MKETQGWELAFQEGACWVAPIQVSRRVATDDTMIHDIDIPKGTILMVCQASAIHNEEVFEEGHLYNVFENPHHIKALLLQMPEVESEEAAVNLNDRVVANCRFLLKAVSLPAASAVGRTLECLGGCSSELRIRNASPPAIVGSRHCGLRR